MDAGVDMTTDNTDGGLYFLKNESAATLEVGIAAAREYGNWGGEFVDDAIRIGEQPFQTSDDWPGGTA